MPDYDITLTAKWEINNYTVVFVNDDGTINRNNTLAYNAVIALPEKPRKTGHTFTWKPNENIEKRGENYVVPDHDVTFSAVWTIINYTIAFDTDGGSEIGNIIVEYNATIPALPATQTNRKRVQRLALQQQAVRAQNNACPQHNPCRAMEHKQLHDHL